MWTLPACGTRYARRFNSHSNTTSTQHPLRGKEISFCYRTVVHVCIITLQRLCLCLCLINCFSHSRRLAVGVGSSFGFSFGFSFGTVSRIFWLGWHSHVGTFVSCTAPSSGIVCLDINCNKALVGAISLALSWYFSFPTIFDNSPTLTSFPELPTTT